MNESLNLKLQQNHGEDEFAKYLTNWGWDNSQVSFLAGDASFRNYYKVEQVDRTAVLMVAPPEYEKPAEYLNISKTLVSMGLSVPEIYHHDVDAGILLIEDFGDVLYSKAISQGDSEMDLYKNAVDALVHMQKSEIPDGAALEAYDWQKVMAELNVFIEWYASDLKPNAVEEFLDLWQEAYNRCPKLSPVLVHRDFMVDNLMKLEGRAGFKSVGIIDFQDAVMGDPTYDLVSLLEDARRDVSRPVVNKMIQYYLDETGIEREAFFHSYFFWGAQRSTKILGVFSRLSKRDSKHKYLNHLSRVWSLLHHDLKHPELIPLFRWFNKYMPEENIT